MSIPKMMSGARAKLSVYNPLTNIAKVLGIFSQVSYNVVYDHAAAFILGRYSAAELEHTSVEPVDISATGWRILDHGMHVDGQLPRVQDLLFYEPIQFLITDRQREALGQEPRVAKIRNVLPISGGASFSAKSLSEMPMRYVGLLVSDESVDNAEHPSAADLP